jgi:heterodisulfide reductase subunit A-like polyferredoxin
VAGDEGIKLVKGKVAKIAEKPDGSLIVTAEDTLTGNKIEEEADLVVLATGMQPEGINPKIVSGLQVDQYGFVLPAGGIISAGCSKKPMDVASSVQDATGVALKAIQSVRGGSNG